MTIKHIDPKAVISVLEEALEMAKKGDFREVQVIAKTPDNQIWSSGSKSCGSHEMAGLLFDAAISRLGYGVR